MTTRADACSVPFRRTLYRLMLIVCALAVLLVAGPALAGQQQAAEAEKARTATEPSRARFAMDPGPSFWVGDVLRLDLLTLLDADFRESPDLEIERGTFTMGHTRCS